MNQSPRTSDSSLAYEAVGQSVTLADVREYWEENTPQYWYTDSEPGSLQYFADLQKVRYRKACPYLKAYAEFGEHAAQEVLEIGCGQGTDLLQYAKGGARVTVIDLTEGAIRRARVIFDAYGLDVRLLSLNVENLWRFEDNSFDFVYSFGVLNHTADTTQAISEVHRVLKSGRTAIVMLYAKGLTWLLAFLYWYFYKGEFLNGSFETSLSRHAEHVEGCSLANYYSKQQCRELFQDFKSVEVTQLHSYNLERDPKAVAKLFKLKHAIARILNRSRITQSIFGRHIMIKATKRQLAFLAGKAPQYCFFESLTRPTV